MSIYNARVQMIPFALIRFVFFGIALAVFCGALLSLSSCVEETPVKIGFVGGLTGRVSDLGVAGRDGLLLAVEEVNRRGGINGRLVELVVRDDRQDAESARLAVNQLIEEQVVAIVGPMTSSMAVVVQPITTAKKTVMISPTVKTDQLSLLDDYFFRVTTPLSRNARQLAQHARKNLDLKRFAVVFDLNNRAFTEAWLDYFREAFAADLVGQVVATESFSSAPEVHFLPIAERVIAAEPDGVLLLSNAIDTALLAQQFRKLGSDLPLFSAEWASTTDLHSFGGRAVEGMTTFHSVCFGSQEERYLVFKKNFEARFGYAPSFASVLAYDAATFLFAGLRQGHDSRELKQTLLSLEPVEGLQSKVKFDRYGDVDRTLFLTVVRDGSFVVDE